MTPSQQALAQVAAILFFKMWLAGTTTTYVRGRVMASPNAEDERVMTFFNRVFRVPTQPLTYFAGWQSIAKLVADSGLSQAEAHARLLAHGPSLPRNLAI